MFRNATSQFLDEFNLALFAKHFIRDFFGFSCWQIN